MIDIPTVFILGAGASVPYGYLIAADLRTSIIKNFHDQLYLLLKKEGIEEPDVKNFVDGAQEFINVFKRSGVESIDKFLSVTPSFTNYGKIAIILSMLHEEKKSNLHKETGPSGAREDWYKLLFNRMISELKQPSDFVKFRENKVAFITFNYDRSFDYFLYDSFSHTFFDKRREFETSINKYIPFPIIHVYGQVDEIKWFGGSDYHASYDFRTIEKLSHNIKVIEERSRDLDEIAKIISTHKRIFFLGFRYAEENMDAIGMPESVNEDWNIYGTAYGMTEKEISNVKKTFIKNFRDKSGRITNPRIENKTCYELLREYL